MAVPRLIDVSRPLRPGTPTWPGDRPFEIHRQTLPNLVLSAISTSCHVGTHLEAPEHVGHEGATVDTIPLEVINGPAEVVAVKAGADLIGRESIAEGWRPVCQRVLFRTDSYGLDDEIGPGYPGLDPAFVGWLAGLRVTVVGVDTPSVDPFHSKELEAHHELSRRGMAWIEGLWLGAAAVGRYRMLALPLPLVGVDAAPMRVVLEVTR